MSTNSAPHRRCLNPFAFHTLRCAASPSPHASRRGFNVGARRLIQLGKTARGWILCLVFHTPHAKSLTLTGAAHGSPSSLWPSKLAEGSVHLSHTGSFRVQVGIHPIASLSPSFCWPLVSLCGMKACSESSISQRVLLLPHFCFSVELQIRSFDSTLAVNPSQACPAALRPRLSEQLLPQSKLSLKTLRCPCITTCEPATQVSKELRNGARALGARAHPLYPSSLAALETRALPALSPTEQS